MIESTADYMNRMANSPDALDREFARVMTAMFVGPTFHPLAPAPLAPVASPDSAPAAVFSEESA